MYILTFGPFVAYHSLLAVYDPATPYHVNNVGFHNFFTPGWVYEPPRSLHLHLDYLAPPGTKGAPTCLSLASVWRRCWRRRARAAPWCWCSS